MEICESVEKPKNPWLSAADLRRLYMDVWWIRATRKTIKCDCCGMRERVPARIGPRFTFQSNFFYSKHCFCTHRDPKFRVNFYPTMIAYDQKIVLRGFEARRHITATRIPDYIHINTKQLRCGECKVEEIILGMNRNERDIHLWDFIQLHRFCKREKRAERCEVF